MRMRRHRVDNATSSAIQGYEAFKSVISANPFVTHDDNSFVIDDDSNHARGVGRVGPKRVVIVPLGTSSIRSADSFSF